MDIREIAENIEGFASDMDCVNDALCIVVEGIMNNCPAHLTYHANALYALSNQFFTLTQNLSAYAMSGFEKKEFQTDRFGGRHL